MDGRVQRSTRTRRLVVDSFLDLLTEGEPQPPAQQVSDRCGASMRSIFRLFDDVEALHAAAIAAQFERVAHLVVTLSPDGPVEDRVRALVKSRAELFEVISPVRRFAVRLAPTSRLIWTDLEGANRYFRMQLEELFAAELGALPPSRRADVSHALDVATSWETWERMRGIQHASERQATRVMTQLVQALLN